MCSTCSFFGCAGSSFCAVALCRLLSSCVWASRCGGLSCCGAQAPGHSSFSSCSSQAPGLGLSDCGSAAPQRVESSRTRDGTCVPCNGRQILIHCTTREVLLCSTLLSSETSPGTPEPSPFQQTLAPLCVCQDHPSPPPSDCSVETSSWVPGWKLGDQCASGFQSGRRGVTVGT